MAGIEKAAARINLWTSLGQRLFQIVDALGGWRIVIPGAGFLVIAWGAVVYVVDHLPLWALSLAILMLVGATFYAYAAIRKAWAVRGIKKLDLSMISASCLEFERQYAQFIEDNQDRIRTMMQAQNVIGPTMMDRYEEGRLIEQEIMHRMRLRLGGALGAIVAMGNAVGIKIDSDFRSLHWSGQMARYVGAVGRLLSNGLLDEARGLNSHQLFF